MSNTITTGAGGVSGIPSAAEMNGFSEGLKTKSSEDLVKGLANTPPGWEHDAIAKELASRGAKSDAAQSSGTSEDDIQKLLKKLMNGTISDDELKKLAGVLGMKPEDLQALKGKSEADSVGGSDITGG